MDVDDSASDSFMDVEGRRLASHWSSEAKVLLLLLLLLEKNKFKTTV